jgi:hypothetical protein
MSQTAPGMPPAPATVLFDRSRDADLHCSACDAVVADDDAECPSCDAPLNWGASIAALREWEGQQA